MARRSVMMVEACDSLGCTGGDLDCAEFEHNGPIGGDALGEPVMVMCKEGGS